MAAELYKNNFKYHETLKYSLGIHLMDPSFMVKYVTQMLYAVILIVANYGHVTIHL